MVAHTIFDQHGTGNLPLGELYADDQIRIDEAFANTNVLEDYHHFTRTINHLDVTCPLGATNDNFAVFALRLLGYAPRE